MRRHQKAESTAVLLAALLAGAGVSLEVGADQKETTVKQAATKALTVKTAMPEFGLLPTFESKIPSEASWPRGIGSKERVDGVFFEMPDHVKKQPSKINRYVEIFPSAEDAKARSKRTPPPSDTCFQTAFPGSGDDKTLRWNGNLTTMTSISPHPRKDGQNLKDLVSVYPLMMQKIIDRGEEKIELETSVAWVDASSFGARLLFQETAEFVLMKQIPGRIRIYANRDADEITFLIRPMRHPGGEISIANASVTYRDTSSSALGGCHLLVKLPTQKGGSSAVADLEVLMEVVVSPQLPHAQTDPASPTREFRRPAIAEARVRSMRIAFAISWLSLDAEPVISISHGWVGRERIHPLPIGHG